MKVVVSNTVTVVAVPLEVDSAVLVVDDSLVVLVLKILLMPTVAEDMTELLKEVVLVSTPEAGVVGMILTEEFNQRVEKAIGVMDIVD